MTSQRAMQSLLAVALATIVTGQTTTLAPATPPRVPKQSLDGSLTDQCCVAMPILASCFGYRANGNNSVVLRAALDTCKASFTIDYVPGSDGVWILEGLESGSKSFPFVAGFNLNVSNVRVTVAQGVTLQALRGGYHGLHDVLVVVGGANVTGTAIVGEGNSTLQMWQEDYRTKAYVHSEWRHGVLVAKAANAELRNLRITDTGGDGIDVCQNSVNVTVASVITERAFRNGMSVTGVTNLTVMDSQFLDTGGTCCMSGLDIEPEVASEAATGILFKNVTFAGNAMNQVTLSLYGLKNNTVDILFDGCTIGPTGGQNMGGVVVSGEGNLTKGTVEFRNTLIQHTGDYGMVISHAYPGASSLVFTNVTLNNTAYKGHWPVIVGGGSVVFNNLTVIDTAVGKYGRHWLMGGKADAPRPPIHNISGTATVFTKWDSPPCCWPVMQACCDCMPVAANGSTDVNIQVHCFNTTSLGLV